MNYCYPKGTHFALLGSKTLDNRRVYIQFSNYYIIDCFLSMDEPTQINSWASLSKYNIEEYLKSIRNEDAKILITFRRSEPWEECVAYLQGKGFKLFDDYNIFFLLEDSIDLAVIAGIEQDEDAIGSLLRKFAAGKKMYFINGNCQTTMLQKYLAGNKVFSSKYMYINLPRIMDLKESDESLYLIALKYADLCLTQPVNAGNKFSALLSTVSIKNHLNAQAQCIVFPKLYFCGYFPQFKKAQANALDFGGKPVFAYGDKYIDDMLEAGCSCEEIHSTIMDPDFLSRGDVLEYFNEQLELCRKDEQECDVKMFDYINYFAKHEILWHAFNHPCNKVLKELAVRIMMTIGLARTDAENFTDEDEIDGCDMMKAQMQIVYPSVYKALDIERRSRGFRLNRNTSTISVDEESYIRMYCNSHAAPVQTFDIWGSCVSRELFNFTAKFNVGAYILQNPVHTMWCNPVAIDEDKIEGTSNFTKRMACLDFHKESVGYINDHFKSKHLMIDVCDCRNDVYAIRDEDGGISYVCDSLSTEKIIQNAFGDKQYQRISALELPDEYWDECLAKFVQLIESRYSEENIVINEFVFAEQYIDFDGTVKSFPEDKVGYYRKKGILCQEIEDKLKKLMPKAKVLTALQKPAGNAAHKLGLALMHYTDEYYYDKVKKLTSLFYKN